MYTQELASNMVVRIFLEGTHRSVTETLFLHTINAQPRTLERSTNTEVLFFFACRLGLMDGSSTTRDWCLYM